jgi:hypothetical protein
MSEDVDFRLAIKRMLNEIREKAYQEKLQLDKEKAIKKSVFRKKLFKKNK